MPRSLEHTNSFHMARRIAKIVAPDFRVLSTDALARGTYVLDMRAKTIEVSELAREFEAATMILFAAGHLRQRERQDLYEHNGGRNFLKDEDAIEVLAEQGAKADLEAAKWAYEVMMANFNIEDISAKSQIGKLCWDVSEWREFYSDFSS